MFGLLKYYHLKKIYFFVIFLLFIAVSINAKEYEPQIVKDIRSETYSSSPSYLTNLNELLFFKARDNDHGYELWRSDGTEAGTFIVKDISPGSNSSVPSDFIQIGDILFFCAKEDVHGAELWRSDGTEAGTIMVKDIQPGDCGSYPEKMTNVNGTLFFRADDGSGDALWRSDGTEEGTFLVKNINPNTLTAVNETLFFTYEQSSPDEIEVWISDGTGEGTYMLKNINPDGPSYPNYLTPVGDTLFFSACENINGRTLWRSDGTEAGTFMVKDIDPNTSDSTGGPRNLVNVNGVLYFTIYDLENSTQLWKSDGTAETTVKVATIHPTEYVRVKNFTAADDMLFFVVDDNIHGFELWRSDGTEAGTFMVKDINPAGGSDPDYLTNAYGTLFFSADDGVNGRELWQSDGTEAGTFMVKDIEPDGSGDPKYFCTIGNSLFFTAYDAAHGKELWKLPVDDGVFGFDDIEFWAGTGTNQAAFIVDWNDDKNMQSLAWGYRWDGEATGEDMFRSVMNADSDLYAYLEHWENPEGYTLYGMGYDIDDDGFGYVPGTGGLGHESNDDGHAIDADDHWKEGWMTGGYWAYYLSSNNGENWDYSGVGMSGRNLSDGDWDGWSFTLLSTFGAGNQPDTPEPAPYEPSPFAVEVVEFGGEFGPEPYHSPEALLGKPATHFKDMNGNTGRIKLIEPAWIYGTLSEPLITTHNNNCFVTVKFDHKVTDDPRNPYGIDMIVFGNSFFIAPGGGVSDATNMNDITLPGGGWFENDKIKVSVSQDGQNWYTYDSGPYPDTLFPTQAYHWDKKNAQWTDKEMDWTRPVNPNLTEEDFTGITGAQAIDLYKGSAGGTGYDLSESGFKWIQYVKVEGFDGTGGTTGGAEIDAFSDVAPLSGDFNNDNRVDLVDAIIGLQVIAGTRTHELPISLSNIICNLQILTGSFPY